nr:ribosomal protein S15 [Meconopsis horridula]QGX06748.1 ribosomal protein S15 [Meconopsis racemosa]
MIKNAFISVIPQEVKE